jgi:hypothetical protein
MSLFQLCICAIAVIVLAVLVVGWVVGGSGGNYHGPDLGNHQRKDGEDK